MFEIWILIFTAVIIPDFHGSDIIIPDANTWFDWSTAGRTVHQAGRLIYKVLAVLSPLQDFVIISLAAETS